MIPHFFIVGPPVLTPKQMAAPVVAGNYNLSKVGTAPVAVVQPLPVAKVV